MKISASETQQIDNYILQKMPVQNRLVFDARMILNPALREDVKWQGKVHELVQLRGRKQLLAQIKKVEQKVFSMPEYSSFRQRLWSWFGK
jgi:hypothetical protein